MNWLETSRRTLQRDTTRWPHRVSSGPSDRHGAKPQTGTCAICTALFKKTWSSCIRAVQGHASALDPVYSEAQWHSQSWGVRSAFRCQFARSRSRSLYGWGFAPPGGVVSGLWLSWPLVCIQSVLFCLYAMCPPGHRGAQSPLCAYPCCSNWWWAIGCRCYKKREGADLWLSSSSLLLWTGGHVEMFYQTELRPTVFPVETFKIISPLASMGGKSFLLTSFSPVIFAREVSFIVICFSFLLGKNFKTFCLLFWPCQTGCQSG